MVPSVADLLAQAQDHSDRLDFDECRRLCELALQADGTSLDALLMYASCQIEQGRMEEAKGLLLRAVALAPDSGYEKYLALAQLSAEKTALSYYSNAARIMKEGLPAAREEERPELLRQLSNIYCAAAELFLTDLCFDEQAEQECGALVGQAIGVDAGNPEAFRVQADFRLSQENKEGAMESITRALDLLKAMSFDDALYPLYDQRLALAKLLVEVEQYESASDILEALLEEDEDVIDTWYLFGISQASLGDAESAVEAFVGVLALMLRVDGADLDTEQRDSVYEYLKGMGVDGPRVWADLETDYKEQLAFAAEQTPDGE